MERARYAVLRHEGVAQPHFDLLVERTPGGALAAWRVERWPLGGGEELEQLADHRRIYLDYEGEVSGGRGAVKRVAGGECDVERGVDRWEVRIEAMTLHLERVGEGKRLWVCRSGSHRGEPTDG